MKLGILKETYTGERRVALIPAHVEPTRKLGFEVLVESSAGLEAGFADTAYETAGARIAAREVVLAEAEVLLQVRTYGDHPGEARPALDELRAGQTIIGFSNPLGAPRRAQDLAEKKIDCFSMELIPRITRAQSMDALSSMATVAGYKAVLLAANTLPRLFPMLMTAAGTLTPAKVFVIGAGVAGLQAIATAKRLGAVLEAYDVRPQVREQVESVGAKFVSLDLDTQSAEDRGGYAKALSEAELERQRELMGQVVARANVVITTAAIPGKRSPVLVTGAMVEQMAAGSVIVDLAAERGGNCALTVPDQIVRHGGVTILGPTNLPAEVPNHASQMYSKNITTLLKHLTKEQQLSFDPSDEITAATLVTRGGEVVHGRVRELLGGAKENGDG